MGETASWQDGQGDAKTRDLIYASIGVHPHEAKLASENDYAELEQLARHRRAIGFGEIGLDYYYDHPRRKESVGFISTD